MADVGIARVDPRSVFRRDARAAATLLLLAITVTQYDVIFQRRSLITSNFSNPLDHRPLPDNYGPDLIPHEEWSRRNLWPYANIRDPGATWWQWEPSTQFLKQAIAERERPFWDPYIAGGTPAMANLVPAFFFPPYALVVVLGAPVALLNGYFLFILWAGAFFTFLFIRAHEVGFAGAMTGAIVVLLSGTSSQHAGTFIGQTAACLPVVMYATRVFYDAPSGPRTALLGMAYATAALASFPPVLVAIFLVVSIYSLVLLVVAPSVSRWRAAVWWGAGVALALGAVAFYYLPAIALRAAASQVSDLYRHAGLETVPLTHIYQLLSPTLMGGVQTYQNLTGITRQGGPYLPHTGIVAIALASLARTCPKCKSRTLLLGTLTPLILIASKLFGVSGFQWLGELPVLREIHIAHYFGLVLPFLLACLAALGIDAIWKGTIGAIRALVTAFGVIVFTESLWQIAEHRRVFRSPAADYWTRDWRVLAAITVIGAATLLVAAVARRNRRTRLAAVGVVIAAAVAEGMYNGWLPNPRAWSIFDHPVPFIRLLQHADTLTRVFPVGAPNANLNSAFRIASVESLMAFNPPRAYAMYRRYWEPVPSVFMREATRLAPDPILDRSNVGFIGINKHFARFVEAAKSRGYKAVFDDGFIVVFERPTLPRFFFGSAFRVVPAAEAIEAIAAPDSREIVLEKPPGVPAAPNTGSDPEVRVLAYHRNSVTLEVDAPRPGLVYASESYFDGWTSLRNGSPVEILPANYAFRAVAVPPGRSRIEFRYWPPGLTAGLWTSTVSLFGVLALLLAPGITRGAFARRTRSAVP